MTDESVIGQILSCPKCESMVLIEPPAHWRKAAPGVAALVVGGNSAAGSGQIISAPSIAKPAAPPLPPPLPTIAPSPTPSLTPAPSVGSTSTITPLASPAAAAAGRTPRDYWVLGGGIAGGIAMGALVFVLIVPGKSKKEPPAVTSVSVESAAATQVAEAAATATTTDMPPVEETQAAQVAATEVRSLKPVTDDVVEEDVLEEAGAKPPAEEQPLLVADDAEEAQEEMADEAGLVDQSNGIEPNEAETELAIPIPATGPQPNVLLAKLDRQVYKIAFDKVPLRQFAAFVSEYGEVRVVIDSESLKAANIKAPTISAKQSEISLNQLLRTSLEELRLTFEPRDGAIVIFAQPPTT